MLDMAKVTPHDYVIDLGSGDGRTVITAAKRGAKALGIEYNPDMVELSKRNAEKAGVGDKANIHRRPTSSKATFSQATVITMYLLPTINLKLRPKILDLKPGTRIVSTRIHDGRLAADQTDTFDGRTGCDGDVWIVPAKVEGTWQLAQGELASQPDLSDGDRHLDRRRNRPITNGKLRGDQIAFTAGNARIHGPRQRQQHRRHGRGSQLRSLDATAQAPSRRRGEIGPD